ncbi:DNA polymerase III subunit epsilon, partial [Pseudomonas frederiksbergensis]|nr:DNA polymerase III subunit epsilon [Pseudomonas frederiksbergensis]
HGADGEEEGQDKRASEIRRLPASRQPGRIIRASEQELELHMARLEAIAKSAGAPALWQQLADAN